MSTKVSPEVAGDIDEVCRSLGTTRSAWLTGLITEALGGSPPDTVKALVSRVEELEAWRARLAG